MGTIPSSVVILSERYPDPDLNTRFLHQPDIRLLTRSRGEEALELVRREPPGLVIEDLGASGDPGPEFCSRLKGDPQTCSIPLILVAPENALDEAREARPDELLCRPLMPHELFEAVRGYIRLPGRRHLRHAVNLRFTFEVEGRVVQAFSRNVSLGGALLKTDRAIGTGTRLDLCFCLPGFPMEIRCTGLVRRGHGLGPHRAQHGVGVEFEEIDPEDLQRLESFVRHHQRRRFGLV